MALSLTSAPETEPVTAAEAKDQLRVDVTDDDDWLNNFGIPTARRIAETFTHRALITQTWVLRLTGFGGRPIYLPRPPLVSISTVAYTDSAGAAQAWAESGTGYDLEQPTGEQALHASIRPAYGESYPSTRNEVDAVAITYVAGYGAASTVPVGIKHGILMLIADLYEQRRSEVLGTSRSKTYLTAESLLSPFRADRLDLRFD
tara:strand:- start:2631 stop:3239 length:609 start_codon:yes stop_codon:yes gene_type:complete